LQESTVVAASVSPYDPFQQFMQFEFPSVSLYVPGWHAEQSFVPPFNPYPAAQIQAFSAMLPLGETLKFPHALQSLTDVKAVDGLYVLAGQSVQPEFPV
jgi:hypothetical protein